jgi:hypothetical protein
MYKYKYLYKYLYKYIYKNEKILKFKFYKSSCFVYGLFAIVQWAEHLPNFMNYCFFLYFSVSIVLVVLVKKQKH